MKPYLPIPARATSSDPEVVANHRCLAQRDAVLRRFGFDAAASVGFVLQAALPLRGRVLDVGTGKGRFVVPLAGRVPNVTTVDISAAEQRCAQLEARWAGVADRIRFVLHDARRLPWPAHHFDAVLSWNVFHHLQDPGRAFREMLRVLRPGGKLVLADFAPSGFRLMDEIHAAEGRRHPHPASGFPHWRALLRELSFTVRRLEGEHQEVIVARKPS